MVGYKWSIDGQWRGEIVNWWNSSMKMGVAFHWRIVSSCFKSLWPLCQKTYLNFWTDLCPSCDFQEKKKKRGNISSFVLILFLLTLTQLHLSSLSGKWYDEESIDDECKWIGCKLDVFSHHQNGGEKTAHWWGLCNGSIWGEQSENCWIGGAAFRLSWAGGISHSDCRFENSGDKGIEKMMMLQGLPNWRIRLFISPISLSLVRVTRKNEEANSSTLQT